MYSGLALVCASSSVRNCSALTNSMATCSFMSSPQPATMMNEEAFLIASPKKEFYRDAEVLADLVGGEYGAMNALSDEEFVSKFVLAEQICRYEQILRKRRWLFIFIYVFF